ncbi:hypothetical protein EYC98_15595 [Halieaceae bacterium IMCC14734]|uniref:MotA/TolQ/ExbB proton channel domain-containing protein n=1 Tax=Candidatus Litorirhabdus singularis TaxID=2518993 RepID=A0ABT3TIY3_9GAMM|nr:hypothetical protein [Candidatus Litorirhabdus singularis]MCX2982286.1 hypothetical protein [Candidatus Litorirhabdus singularis]
MAAFKASRSFFGGMVAGLSTSFVVLVMLPRWLSDNAGLNVPESLKTLWSLAELNLQGAILPFALLLICFLVLLQRLNSALDVDQPALSQVLRLDQLLDLAATLFFGVGVIWTAVGMRGALLHGLGDPGAGVGESAFSVLQRLVDGGILLALSTTIVGGMGGYLMRLIKTLWLGSALNAVYMHAQQERLAEGIDALQRIEQLLHSGALASAGLSPGEAQATN